MSAMVGFLRTQKSPYRSIGMNVSIRKKIKMKTLKYINYDSPF